MSTKIYNAYIFTKSPEALIPFLFKIRKQYTEYLIQDFSCIKPQGSLRWDTEGFLLKEIREATIKGAEEPFNIDASAVVYFFKGKIYIQFFGLPHTLMSEVHKKRAIRDFHYQDQSDKSARVSDDRWEERGEIWEKIFEVVSPIPSQAGLHYEFYDVYEIANKVSYIIHNKKKVCVK